MQQKDEQQLIARVLDGHVEDYGYFMERYGAEVFRLVARLVPLQQDAEELVQDVFVRAYNRLYTYTGEAAFPTWLCRIAYRLTVSWLRKQKMVYTTLDERTEVSSADVDQLLDDETRTSQLADAVGQLAPDEQTLINLYYYDGRPLRDIAYILGLEPGNVATRLHRIRKKLYIIIKKMDET